MARFVLRIEYVGTRFRGWQIQENARTIQGDIAEAVSLVTGRSDFELYGSGRTDAGVHALLQVAHLDVDTAIPPEKLRQDLNDSLPPDINILSLERVARDFHARHGAIGRSYIYQIARRRTAFGKPFVWWVRDRLDVLPMRQAAQTFVGFHDFRGFTAVDPDEMSTKVKIEAFDVAEADDLILIRIRGSHFLWKMVRRLVGVLVEVGRGHLSLEAAKNLLDNPAGLPAELTAPPSGLYLEQVIYEGEVFDRPLVPAFAVTSAPVSRRFAPPPSWKVDEEVSTAEREAAAPKSRPAGDDRTKRYVPGRKPGHAAPRGRRREPSEGTERGSRPRPAEEPEGVDRRPNPRKRFEGRGDADRKPYATKPYAEGRGEGSGRGASGDTYRKPYARKPYGEGRGEGSSRGASGDTYRKPYARKPYGEGRSEGSSRGASGDTYRKPYAKKPYGEGRDEGSGRGATGDTYRKPYAKKPYGEGRGAGSGRGATGDTYRKPYAKKPYGEGRGEGSSRGGTGDTYRKPYAKKGGSARGRSGASRPPTRRAGPKRRT